MLKPKTFDMFNEHQISVIGCSRVEEKTTIYSEVLEWFSVKGVATKVFHGKWEGL